MSVVDLLSIYCEAGKPTITAEAILASLDALPLDQVQLIERYVIAGRARRRRTELLQRRNELLARLIQADRLPTRTTVQWREIHRRFTALYPAASLLSQQQLHDDGTTEMYPHLVSARSLRTAFERWQRDRNSL